MSDTTANELRARCDNTGRWGSDDERGTLNHISPQKTVSALSTVDAGDVVALGKTLRVRDSAEVPPSATLLMTSIHGCAKDILVLSVHGFEVTHIDAVAHNTFRGRVYNDRPADEALTSSGLCFGSVLAASAGIVTRGVLLDVAHARGVPYLAAGDGISVADLEAAEALAGVRVTAGDAVFVRSGRDLRLAETTEPPEPREGVLPEVLPWLHVRNVAVYAGDCIERMPSGVPGLPMPLHDIGGPAMGLCILDNPDVERLRAGCLRHARSFFALMIAPLPIPGGTGSAANPLALF